MKLKQGYIVCFVAHSILTNHLDLSKLNNNILTCKQSHDISERSRHAREITFNTIKDGAIIYFK